MDQYSEHQKKAIEKLERKGLLEKHQQLAAQGFDHPWKNLWLLKENNGDLEKVKQQLTEWKVGKAKKLDIALQAIEKLGYVEQNQVLVQKGYKSAHKNLKVLLKTGGDLVKAEELLAEQLKEIDHGRKGRHGGKWKRSHSRKRSHSHKRSHSRKSHSNRRRHSQESALQAIDKLGYLEQHQALASKGYDRAGRNLKVLVQTNGDLTQAEAYLNECQSKERHHRGGHHGRGGRGNHSRGHYDRSHSRGHSHRGQESQRQGRGPCGRGPWGASPYQTDQELEQMIQQCGFKEQSDKLKELGYNNLRKNFWALKKNFGDLESVIFKFMEKERQVKVIRYQKIKESTVFQEKKDELKDKIKKLKQQGLNKKQALRVLAMFNGDIQAVNALFV